MGQLAEDKVSVLYMDTPHAAPVDEKPRIFNVKIAGGQLAGVPALLCIISVGGSSRLLLQIR